MIQPVGLYAQSTGQVTTEANGKMGKNEFLAMLVTQMKYQDPLNPTDNTAMIAQMAQFSQLEQMMAMTEAFSGLQTVAMLGKVVSATATDGSTMVGKVVSVSLNGDTPLLNANLGEMTPTGFAEYTPPATALIALKDVFDVTF